MAHFFYSCARAAQRIIAKALDKWVARFNSTRKKKNMINYKRPNTSLFL